jgi:ribonuclease HII
LAEESKLLQIGYRHIAGIDEVGRGALAGPVVAAAVILPLDIDFSWFKLVRDSKEVSPARRNQLYILIQEAAIAAAVGVIEPQIIDSIGIFKAAKLAMCQAIERLACSPDFLLIDALTLPQLRTKQKGIIRGDKLCLSIACASIVAKVTRDRIMAELDSVHPGYNLAKHKGYATRQHCVCLQQLGPSPIHRHSFAPVRETCRLI